LLLMILMIAFPYKRFSLLGITRKRNQPEKR
jgi:hypothetical protein